MKYNKIYFKKTIQRRIMKMQLKIKKRTEGPSTKKVMIYGEDGSGKSTFAEKYCKKYGLKAIVIDIDDTNYTDMDIVNVNMKSDLTLFNTLNKTIEAINESDYDTIVIDGTGSIFEGLTSTAKGMRKYADRAERFNLLLRTFLATKKNLIFIGQVDMKVIYNEEHQTPKAIIKLNSLMNERYCTVRDGNEFSVECEKYRGDDSMLKTFPL